MWILLLPIVTWPAIAIIFGEANEPFPFYAALASLLNGLHLIFWTAADYYIRTSLRPLNKFTLQFGPFLFLLNFSSTSYLISLYLQDPSVLLTVKTAYTVIFSVLSNFIILLLIAESLSSVLDTPEFSTRRKLNIYAFIGSVIFVLICIMIYLNFQITSQSEECLAVRSYWIRTAWKYLLSIVCIVSAVIILITSYRYRALVTVLMFLSFGFLLLGALWYKDCVQIIRTGSFSRCSEHLVSTAIQLIIETVLAIPGIMGMIWFVINMFLGTLCLIAYLGVRLVCPQYLPQMLWMRRRRDSNENEGVELNLIRLESKSFDPQAHSPSFQETGLCVICLENFIKDERVVYWEVCHHVFHKSCLEKWTAKHNTCPTCKRPAQLQEQDQIGIEQN